MSVTASGADPGSGCVLSTPTGVGVELTLNRPERLNAVSEELYSELIEHLVAADEDVRVRAVVIRGAGRAFCAGADVKAHRSARRTVAGRAAYVELGQRACRQIQTMRKPVIAAVHGYAIGAGAEIACSADFIVATTDAVFRLPEVILGTFVGGGITYRLPRLIGLARATGLFVLGEGFTGQDGLRWGLVHSAVEPNELDTATGRLAERLAAASPRSVTLMKAALTDLPALDSALAFEARALLSMMETADWAEGVDAAAQRRSAKFDYDG